MAERHAAYFLELAEESERAERGEDQASWLDRLEAELDNLRVALAWLRIHNATASLRMASALSWFWVTRGHYIEGRAWLEGALAAAPAAAPERAWALLALARIGTWQADYAASQRFGEEALQLFDQLGEVVNRDWTLTLLGYIHAQQGDHPAGRRQFEAAFASSEDELVRMEALVGLGEMLLQVGDLAEARRALEPVAGLAQGPLGPRGRAALFLGIVAVLEADGPTASAQLTSALDILGPLHNQYGIAATLDAIAALAVAADDPGTALRLCGAADALRGSIRAELAPRWRELLQSVVMVPATAAAGDRAEAARLEGEQMTLEEAIDYASGWLAEAPVHHALTTLSIRPLARTVRFGLTRRQLEVAALITRGMTNRAIADQLVVSERTVEGHVEQIRHKLGFHSRVQIAAWMTEQRVWLGRAN